MPPPAECPTIAILPLRTVFGNAARVAATVGVEDVVLGARGRGRRAELRAEAALEEVR